MIVLPVTPAGVRSVPEKVQEQALMTMQGIITAQPR
jgi:hypothetical protein